MDDSPRPEFIAALTGSLGRMLTVGDAEGSTIAVKALDEPIRLVDTRDGPVARDDAASPSSSPPAFAAPARTNPAIQTALERELASDDFALRGSHRMIDLAEARRFFRTTRRS